MKNFDIGSICNPNIFFNGKEDSTWFKTDVDFTVRRLGNESYAFEGDNQWLLWGKRENTVGADILDTSQNCISFMITNPNEDLEYIWKPVHPRSIEYEINHPLFVDNQAPQPELWEEYFKDSQDESKDCLPSFKFDDAKVQSEIENNQKSVMIDFELIDMNEEDETKKRGPRRMKFNRWNKRDDARMFKTINTLISKNKISNKFIEDPDELDVTNDAKDFKSLATAIKWKNSYADLKKRIQKVLASEDLTVRDYGLLKKIIYEKYLISHVDYDLIMQEFPGKSFEVLSKAWARIKRGYKYIKKH